MHAPALPDNPPAPDDGTPRTRPSDYQLPLYNRSQPEIVPFLERVRTVMDGHDGGFTVAEVGGLNCDAEMKSFTAGDHRLNSAYGFDFLYATRLSPRLVADTLARWPDTPGMGWPSWAFENHDVPRAASRLADPEHRDASNRLRMLLLACLRGNIFLYQGEELGLTQVDVPFDRLRDPEAIANWPLTLGRDGARTPMPWRHDAPGLGFSVGEPWLPFGPDHAALAVDTQEAEPASLLNLTRRMLALRRAHDALRLGDLTILVTDGDLLVFVRAWRGERLLCAFDFGPAPVRPLPIAREGWTLVERIGGGEGWLLEGWGGLVARAEA